jgi:large subunit ribosomal protein L4
MKIKIYQKDGTESGKSVTLDKTVFEVEPNDHAVWLDVRRIQASARQGTHKTKDRGEVAGSTRKIYRQKGTGSARAGSAKSPIRRSGGTIFGPRPHSYNLKVNRKTRGVARRSALTYKAKEKAIRVVEDFSFEQPDTNALKGIIDSLELSGQRVLLLTHVPSPDVFLSGRNVSKLTVLNAADVSTLDVMAAHVLLLQKGALATLSSQLGTKKKK